MAIIFNKLQKPFSDYLGIFSSLFCLAHCLLAPAILSFQFMFIYNALQYEIIEYTFLLMSFVAVFFSANKFSSIVSIIMWFIFLIFAASLLFHDVVPVSVAYLSSAGLILLHFLNLIKIKKLKININHQN